MGVLAHAQPKRAQVKRSNVCPVEDKKRILGVELLQVNLLDQGEAVPAAQGRDVYVELREWMERFRDEVQAGMAVDDREVVAEALEAIEKDLSPLRDLSPSPLVRDHRFHTRLQLCLILPLAGIRTFADVEDDRQVAPCQLIVAVGADQRFDVELRHVRREKEALQERLRPCPQLDQIVHAAAHEVEVGDTRAAAGEPRCLGEHQGDRSLADAALEGLYEDHLHNSGSVVGTVSRKNSAKAGLDSSCRMLASLSRTASRSAGARWG